MASVNKVILLGNLTRDPELSYTPSGTGIAKFGLAVNQKYKDKEDTVFVEITAFGKSGEACAEYLSKVSQVAIVGRLNFSQWEKDGQKRSKLDVIADDVQFLNTKKGNE